MDYFLSTIKMFCTVWVNESYTQTLAEHKKFIHQRPSGGWSLRLNPGPCKARVNNLGLYGQNYQTASTGKQIQKKKPQTMKNYSQHAVRTLLIHTRNYK